MLMSTRLPSNLKPTTCKCVCLVTRSHFRSRDKDGGHTIRSAVAENPMLHANFKALCVIEAELLPIAVLHCGNRDFRLFCSRNLDLDPMTFMYELDMHSVEIYHMSEHELHTSRLSKVIVWQTDRQTWPKLYTAPFGRWSVILRTVLVHLMNVEQCQMAADLRPTWQRQV